MKQLSDIVVSLPLAKELHKRGIVKEGLFYYDKYNCVVDQEDNWSTNREGEPIHTIHIPALTTDELLEMLPESIKPEGYDYHFYLYIDPFADNEGRWKVCYSKEYANRDREGYFELYGDLKSAAAQMLIWLDDNKLLEKK